MYLRAARTFLFIIAALATGACAVRVGGGGPNDFDVVALRAVAADAPADVAARIAAANAHVVLLSAEQDSAWFAAVATATNMHLSGPGISGGIAMGFLTRMEAVGDTTLVLEAPGEGRVHMHDALYRLDAARPLNVMMVRIEADDIRAAVNRLFEYTATDVYAHAPVLLAVDGVTPQAADSVAWLMRAYYNNEIDCPGGEIERGTALPVRLLYGPSARIACRNSRLLPGPTPATVIRAVTGR